MEEKHIRVNPQADPIPSTLSEVPGDQPFQITPMNIGTNVCNTADELHFCLDDSPTFSMIELDTIDSTNNFMRNYHPFVQKKITLATAEFQTAGRGSAQNKWESECGKNIMMSLLVHPSHIEPTRQFALTEVLSLAVCDALNTFCQGFCIKWPNDIYYKDKKIVGMLTENRLSGTEIKDSIMGVGINVNQTVFESDAPNPTSLALILDNETERRFVLERIMKFFTRYYSWTEQHRLDELHKTYLDHLYLSHEEATFKDATGCFKATIIDVEAGSGHIVMTDTEGHERRYAFKEVEFVIQPSKKH